MANEIVKSYKKYIVEKIIEPSIYCVSPYERGKGYKKEVEEFERLLGRQVEKVSDIGKIITGETLAVKDEKGFHRGLVTDVFNRSSKATYWILLVDHGNVIETDHKNIYFIKNEDIKYKKLGAFEVSIHGIQPAAVKLEGDNNYLGGILQKRVAGNWSPKAFQFVKHIIKKNPCVFINTISGNMNMRSISGEIYFMDELSDVPVSLGERLCAKGFAMRCDTLLEESSQDRLQGYNDTGIEGQIPFRALSREIQNCEVLKSLKSPKKGREKINSSNDASIFALQHRLNSEWTYESESLVLQGRSVETCPSSSVSSSSVKYSSSWILKKCQSNIAPPIPPKMGDMYESEQRKSQPSGDCAEGHRAFQ